MKRLAPLPALLCCSVIPVLPQAHNPETPVSVVASKTTSALRVFSHSREGLDLALDKGVAVVSLGEVSVLDGEKIVQTLTLTNSTDKPLKIARCYNPCGCLTARLARADVGVETTAAKGSAAASAGTPRETEYLTLPVDLQPGAPVQLLLTLDLRLLSPGSFQKTIQIDTVANGTKTSDMPALRILEQGTVRSPVIFDPPVLSFSELTAGKGKEQQLVVTPDPRLAAGGEPPALQAQTNLRALDSEIKIELIAPAAGSSHADTFRYRVRVPSNAPIGAFFGLLSFAVDSGWAQQHPKEAAAWRQAILPCTGLIRGSVMASPQGAVFGPVSQKGEDVEIREIRLLPQNAGALQGAAIRTDSNSLETEIVAGNGDEKILRLKLHRKRLAAEFGAAESAPSQLSSLHVYHVYVTLRNDQRLVVPVHVPFEFVSAKKH